MHFRYLKILFVVLTSLLAIIYAAQNVANLEAAHQSFIYVMSGADHPAYPKTFGFETADPMLAWIATAIDIAAEFLAGLLLAIGALAMWSRRRASAAEFRESTKWAAIGAGVGVFVWLGLFAVGGGAFFQMWQNAIGTNSMNGAFQFFVTCALTLIFLNQGEPA